MVVFASAANSSDIKMQLDTAIQKCKAAHELAESARALGVAEDHYTIWFAKNAWNESNDQVKELTKQYNDAVATEKAEQEKGSYLGNFRISFYCPCATCNGTSSGLTASGAYLQVGKTIAVDSSVIPLGKTVYIDGIGYRTAQDTGGAIKGNRIDMLVSSHSEAYANGIVYRDVYVR